MEKILLVDDDPDILEFLSYNLKKENFEVLTAQNGIEAIEVASREMPDLIILDVMMPKMDGVTACEEIRKIPGLSDCLIAFLTARNEDYSQIAAFDAGADDYISKPIRPKVFLSRIKALLKRNSRNDTDNKGNNQLVIGNLTIDKERYLVSVSGNEFSLPRKEFMLLELLVSKPEKVFTRDEIYQTIWGNEVIVGDRTIDVHIRKLREKIGEKHIVTVKGIGYKYVE